MNSHQGCGNVRSDDGSIYKKAVGRGVDFFGWSQRTNSCSRVFQVDLDHTIRAGSLHFVNHDSRHDNRPSYPKPLYNESATMATTTIESASIFMSPPTTPTLIYTRRGLVNKNFFLDLPELESPRSVRTPTPVKQATPFVAVVPASTGSKGPVEPNASTVPRRPGLRRDAGIAWTGIRGA